MANAGYRRWTARKGWRERGLERGPFHFSEPFDAVTIHLPSPFVSVEFGLDCPEKLLSEDVAGIWNDPPLHHEGLLHRVSEHVGQLQAGDVCGFGPDLNVSAGQRFLVLVVTEIDRAAFIHTPVCLLELEILLLAARLGHDVARSE